MKRNTKDPFDIWLGLVVELVIEPVVNVCRSTARALRSSGGSHREHRRRRSRCRKCARRSREERS